MCFCIAHSKVQLGGTVSLSSANPFDFPLIDPAYLTHPVDIAINAESIRKAQRFLSTDSWNGYISGLFSPIDLANTTSLTDWARTQVSSFWHPCCTARMGTEEDPLAVVNAKLLLKGVTGVRIADASVFVSLDSIRPISEV